MGRIRKVETTELDLDERAPSTSDEADEKRLIALAVKAAEKQMREGTASSQIICHYLKLGSSRERLEQEMLQKQKELVTAKTEAIHSADRLEELYSNAINALMRYQGRTPESEEFDENL